MRRFLSLFTMMMLCAVLSFAQSRVVTGRIVGPTGNPVGFATVAIKGGSGQQSDANGEFQIRVNPGAVLVFSATGYEELEITVGSQTVVNATLRLKQNDLAEVVVTGAFNTKKTQRQAVANVQNVTGEQMNTIRQKNVNDALAGKVAGMQVRSKSAAVLGEDNQVRLRGMNGIGTGGGALFVVDGTIMPSAQDINPDDVEDITVLQGPAAAALFGPDGSNGAIVINTKRAKKGQKNVGIEINSGVTFDKVYILPNYQNAYSGGTIGDFLVYNWKPGDPEGWKALDGKYYHDYTEDVSWGPRMAGQEYIPWYAWYPGHERSFQTAKLNPQPNNIRDYFNTGVTLLNNINFTKGGDGYSFRVSYTNLDQKGIVPESYLKKNTLNTSLSIDLGSKFVIAANINYINQKLNSENDEGYSNNTSGSFSQWFHRDLDMDIMRELRYLRSPTGGLATWNHNNPGAYNPNSPRDFWNAYYWFSPYAWQDNVLNYQNKDRVFGDASLTYKVNNDLRLKFTYRKQQLTTARDTRQYNALDLTAGTNSGFSYWEAANGRNRVWGGYGIQNTYSNRQNYELLATYNKTFKDFNLGVTAGLDILKTRSTNYASNTLGGLFVPDVFILSNNKSGITTTYNETNFTRRSLFSNVSLGWKRLVNIEGTYRRDYTSAEKLGDYIDTRSIGANFIFSDLINKNGSTFLSYGKLRGSTGQILNALDPYANSIVYTPGAQAFNGNLLITEPGSQIDPRYHGSTNDEKEIGVDLRFFKNRFGISATYWDRTNKDFPFDATVTGYSGYTSIRTNAGEVKKTGIEMQLMANPVRKENFDWMINASWGRQLKNDVISINDELGILAVVTEAGGNGNISLVSQVGQRWGQLRGSGIARNAAGIPIVRADGIYEKEENKYFGSSLPDYTGGVQNTFTVFKNFTISANIDFSYGGKFFSLSEWYGSSSGLYARTAGLNDKGNPIRDAVADGGGIHVVGVDADDKPVDMYVEARAYFEGNGAYDQEIVEENIHSLTFVKLRELSVGYRIPTEKLGIGKYIKSAMFSVVARNPWLIYTQSKGFDPSEIANNSGEDGQLPGTRGLGVNLRIGF